MCQALHDVVISKRVFQGEEEKAKDEIREMFIIRTDRLTATRSVEGLPIRYLVC